MEKRYDQRCVKCPECAYFRPEGPRKDSLDPDAVWPDACGCYGYTLHNDLPPAEDCDGFLTPAQAAKKAAEMAARRRRK